MEQIKHILPLALLCFLFSLHTKAQSIADSIEQKILFAQSEGHIVDNLTNSFALKPKAEFLLAPPNKDLRFGVLIYNIDIFPDRAEFSAGIAFRDPKSNQLVAFRADHISFSKTNGLTGPAKLFLISDVEMGFGQAATIFIQAGPNASYAVFECKGLQEFGITGSVDFNPDFLLPVNAKGDIEQNKVLQANFSIKAKSWTDMVVQITVSPFQVKGFKNYVFNISRATMDLSETRNANEMKFPEAYHVSENFGNKMDVWEGFYLENGSVTFPDHFTSSSGKRLELGVSNLLIDEFGFSGHIFGTHLLDFEKGRIANWNFSINHAEIELVMNEIVNGRLSGDIGLPILPDTSKLAYSAYVGANDNYGMQVSVRNNLVIPAFKVASVILTPNSYIDMQIKEGELTLQAELNGDFTIVNTKTNADEGAEFNFPSVAFQGFRVSNKDPKIDIEYLGLTKSSGASKFSKYPLCINDIYLMKSGAEKRIGIRFGLNLMEKLAVKAGIAIVAAESDDRLRFKRLDINEIQVRSVTSCFTLEGSIYFIKEDPDYGNGFSGTIKFTIDKPKIEAAASVLFGNVRNHRYWYFDASVVWDKPGIPFFTGAEFNGFLGGAWHGMREVNERDHVKNGQYGLTSIGKQYVPDAKAGLGLRAGVYIRSTGGSGSSSPFMAKVALELQFNSNNGLNKISIFGNVDVMTENTKTDKADLKKNTAAIPGGNAWNSYRSAYKPLGKIGGPFMMEFDFANKVYQANFAIYLQGIADDKIVGIGERGLAGEVSIYFSSSKWYFWVGTPQQPIGVRISLGGAGNAAVAAYFMAGKEVKPAEPLPMEITNILGNKNADAMRELSEMAAGNAFAFGSRLTLQIGSAGHEKRVSIYASLKAIIGFDINVSNYGKATACEGHTGPPGINGWFANGQLFAFLQGAVGANYRLGKINGKLDLLMLTCAAQLYCQGPNPFYSNGSAAIQVNIAGVINKKMNLDFEIGDQCQMKVNQLTDASLIVKVTPDNGAMNVSTIVPVKVKFSVPLDQAFRDKEGRQIVFRLSQFEVKEGERPIPGKMSWNDTKDELVFSPGNVLPEKKRIKVSIYIEASYLTSAFELVNTDGTKMLASKKSNLINSSSYAMAIDEMLKSGRKEMAFDNNARIIRKDQYEAVVLDGRKVDEKKEFYFNTSANPNSIPEVNIDFAYPVPDQTNYYKDESNKGYVQLMTGQGYLTDVSGTKIMALFIDSKGMVVGESRVTLDGKRLQYLMPNKVLKNSAVYTLMVKRLDANAPSELGRNMTVDYNQVKNMFAISVNSLSGTGSPANENVTSKHLVLMSYSFGTSGYSTLSEKLKGSEMSRTSSISEGLLECELSNTMNEYFDFFELKNHGVGRPLLNVNLSLNQLSWFNNEAKKLYAIFNCKDAGLLSYLQLERDTGVYGLYPFKAVLISVGGIDGMKLQKSKTGKEKTRPEYIDKAILIESNLYEIVSKDLAAIQSSLIAYLASGAKVNTLELNRFIAQMVAVKMEKTVSNSSVSGAMKTMAFGTANVSLTSLVVSGPAITNTGGANLRIAQNVTMQKNEMILRISKLKINPPNDDTEFPVSFNYSLPGEKQFNSTCIKKASIKK